MRVIGRIYRGKRPIIVAFFGSFESEFEYSVCKADTIAVVLCLISLEECRSSLGRREIEEDIKMIRR